MLGDRLARTTEGSGSTATDTPSIRPPPAHRKQRPRTNLRAPRCAPQAAPPCWEMMSAGDSHSLPLERNRRAMDWAGGSDAPLPTMKSRRQVRIAAAAASNSA
jgi:hypothetical protein